MQNPFLGELVLLRPFEPEDVPALAGYLNHPDLAGRRNIPWGLPEVVPLSQRQIQAVYEKWAGEEKGLPLAVIAHHARASAGVPGEDRPRLLSMEPRLVGHAEASWEWDPHCPSVSVTIDPAQQRRGYGSDALRLLLRHLFETTVGHAVNCWIAEWNEPALAFAQRYGFRVGGRMRRAGLRHGRPFDVLLTDILRPEWAAQQGGGSDAS